VVDLAFVGLFVAALFALTPPLALVTVLAMPPFVLLSALAHRGRRDAQGRLPRQRRQGLEPERDGDPRAHREGARPGGGDGAALRGPARRERLGRVPLGSAGQLVGSLGQGLQQATALLLIYLGARMIIAGELTVGALVATTILSARALARCASCSRPGRSSSRRATRSAGWTG
jgi:hypothetical protein